MFQDSRKLAYYLIGGALPVLAVLLSAIYVSVYHDREMQVASAGQSAQALAVALSKEAEATVYFAELALVRIDEYLSLRAKPLTSSSRDIHELLKWNRQLLRRGEYRDSFGHLFLLGKDGRNIANSVSYPVTQIDASDRGYFQFHLTHRTEDLHISQPMESKVTQERRVFLTKRINDGDGNFVGVAGVHFNLEHFNKMYGQLSLPPSGAVTIVRTDGSGIFRYPAVAAVSDQNIANETFFAEMIAHRYGGLRTISPYDSDLRIVGYRVSEKYPLVSMISVTQASILTNWRQSALVVLLVFLAVLLILGIFILFVRRQVSSIGQLVDISSHDSLTKLWNRRAFDEKFNEELRRATRRGHSLSLLFADIDYFKAFNDSFGHQAGDECLGIVANVLGSNFGRAGEHVFRYGGEEFVVLLPNTSASDALKFGQRVVEALSAKKIPHPSSPVASVVTISVGVATASPDLYYDGNELIDNADKALYKAKSQGRNRVASISSEAV